MVNNVSSILYALTHEEAKNMGEVRRQNEVGKEVQTRVDRKNWLCSSRAQ